MSPPKPSSRASSSQNPPVQVQSQQNLAPQNLPQMSVAQQQKPPKQDLEILLQFEQQKGISVSQKRQQIRQKQDYEKERSQIVKKKIAKENALEGRVKCLKVGCEESFPRVSQMRMHIAQEHKRLADNLGIQLFECILCTHYSSLRKSALDKHQISYAREKRAVLIARGELNDEDALKTEEELEFQRAQKFN